MTSPAKNPAAFTTGTAVPATPGGTTIPNPPPPDVKPKIMMGAWEETYVGSKQFNAKVGGKPLPDWSGLDLSSIRRNITSLHYRPINPATGSKGYATRIKGLDIKFKKGDDISEFQLNVWEHLKSHGLDTISYLQDPYDNSVVVNVVENHPRFSRDVKESERLSQIFSTKFDKFDIENDTCAKTFLLASIDNSLISSLRPRLDDDETFAITWLKLMHMLITTSIVRFDTIKQTIRMMNPMTYAGQNIDTLAQDFIKKAKELESAGYYDHSLTLAMAKSFLKSSCPPTFQFRMLGLVEKLEMGLAHIAFHDNVTAERYMIQEGLSYKEVCMLAASLYRTALDTDEWGPAKLPKDRTVPRAFMLDASKETFTKAEVMNLIQNSGKGGIKSYQKKTVVCYECGEEGHMKKDCPKLKKQHGKNHNKKEKKPFKIQEWKLQEPKSGEEKSKTVNGRKFNWCTKCQRWTTTHTTEEHRDTRKKNPEKEINWCPSVWCMQSFNHESLFNSKPDMTHKSNDKTLSNSKHTPKTRYIKKNKNEKVHYDHPEPSNHNWFNTFQIIYIFLSISFFLISAFRSISFDEMKTFIFDIPTFIINFTQKNWNVMQQIFAPLLWTSTGYIACNIQNLIPINETSNSALLCSKIDRKATRYHDKQKNKPPAFKYVSKSERKLKRTLPLRIRKQIPSVDYNDYHPKSHTNRINRVCNDCFIKSHNENLPFEHHPTKHCHLPTRNSKFKPTKPFHFNPDKVHNKKQSNKRTKKQFKPHTKHDPHLTQNVNMLNKSHDDHISLQVALTAPARFTSTIGKENCFPIIWDSGASISITHCKDDFISFEKCNTTIRGVGNAKNVVKGRGQVLWSMHDSLGMLRHLKLNAYYIPSCKVRLISTTSLLDTYNDESIQLTGNQLVLSGVPDKSDRAQINVPINHANNLPTSLGYRYDTLQNGTKELLNVISTTHDLNNNLTAAEKEVLRWHCRLGHVSFRRIQQLMRSGVLSHTDATRRLHTAGCKLVHAPKCAACLFGKQTTRPSPGKNTSIVRDREGILKANNLLPGQEVSVDHYICSTKGRLFSSYGRTPDSKLYSGGCIFVDHASGYVHTEFQNSLSTHATLTAKVSYEQKCRDYGILPQKYTSDNGSAFTSQGFSQHLSDFKQIIKFAGAGAHHHNGIAERSIRTIMSISRTMMLHSAIHWPIVANAALWPMAVAHAIYIWNHVPSVTTGLSPSDIFTKTRWPNKRYHDLHVWGCPVYVLDKTISDGQKIPRWKPRSRRSMYMGVSPNHASSVPLVLNLDTGAITAQYHIVFDDWFATVPTDTEAIPDFNSDTWAKLFGDSTCHFDDDDIITVTDSITDITHSNDVSNAFDTNHPPVPLPILPPPPLLTTQLPTQPAIVPRRETTNTSADTLPSTNVNNSNSAAMIPTQPIASHNDVPNTMPIDPTPTTTPTVTPLDQPVNSILRRSTRTRQAPSRLNIESSNTKSYAINIAHHFANFFKNSDAPIDPIIFKASKTNTNPDIFNYDQAMNDSEMLHEWKTAMKKEISELEGKGVWEVVDVEEPQSNKQQIVPTTWTLRYKRFPDGTIKKCKARFCMRGDLQEGTESSYSPVVSFSTVRLFLIITLTLGWKSCSIDFANAFVQAVLQQPVYIHLPRGFTSNAPNKKSCLKLKRSLYGSTYAPLLWYEHLFDYLVHQDGFTQSKHDPCLLMKTDIIIIMYVDDAGIAYKDEKTLDELLLRLKKNGFDLTKEGTFSEYLGIQYDEDKQTGNITMTQQGLIKKIVSAVGMEECNPNRTPTTKEALSKDPEGAPMSDPWNYRSVVGMLLYLASNTRPDIVYAVSQVARFSHEPKISHATAIKTLVRYLSGTITKGTIFKRPDNLNIKCFVDADFAGLYNADPPEDKSSAKSRTGYIISVGDCYLVSKSQLQTTISLSTAEAEYYALSQAMRAVIPIRELAIEVLSFIKLPPKFEQMAKSLTTTILEDNNSALTLATKQQVTNRTKHYLVKWHFFWHHVKTVSNPAGTIEVEHVASKDQKADYLTKGLTKDLFENCRRLNQGW